MECLLIIVLFCALKCIHKLFSMDRVHDGQVEGFIGLNPCVCQNKQKRERCWEPSSLVSGTIASLTERKVPWLGLSEKALGT